MPEIIFKAVDERLPARKRWQIARHEFSSYDHDVRAARDKQGCIEQYALAGLTYARQTKDRLLAAAVMEWAQNKFTAV